MTISPFLLFNTFLTNLKDILCSQKTIYLRTQISPFNRLILIVIQSTPKEDLLH